MIIHTTKKLAAKLTKVSRQPLIETNPIGSWHANLYTIDRRNCVMFCHDQTRFTFFAAGLKKDDFSNLDYWFQDLFANTMLKLGYDTHLLEQVLPLLDPLQFDTHCNRSVQGTLNTVRTDLEGMLLRVENVMELPIYSTSARLCDRPVTIKGMKKRDCLWPVREMEGFLKGIVDDV